MQEPSGKIQRLIQDRDRLQSEWDIRNEKLNRLRQALVIEVDPATNFKLEHQIRDEETKIQELVQELDEIERSLASGSISSSLIEIDNLDFDSDHPMPSSNLDPQTILFLAANPQATSRLHLDEELREIAEGLQRAQKREQFKLEQRSATRPRDIQRAMLDAKPRILHFSGHGAGEQGLIFEDETGNPKFVEELECEKAEYNGVKRIQR